MRLGRGLTAGHGILDPAVVVRIHPPQKGERLYMKNQEKELEINAEELEKHLGLLASYLSLLKEIPIADDKRWILEAIEKEIELFSHALLHKDISEELLLERPIKVTALAKDVVKHLSRDAARKGVFLELKAEEGVSPAIGYPVAVRQALTNAIENAVKRSEEGELVSVIIAQVENRVKLEVRENLGDSSFVLFLPIVPQGRRLLLDVLKEEIRRRKDNSGLGAILVSLENYFEIRNLYGDKRVSKYTRKIEEQIRKVLRKDDEVISDGEGKFLILLGSVPDESTLDRVATRIQRVMDKIEEDVNSVFKRSFMLFTDLKELTPESLLNSLEENLE